MQTLKDLTQLRSAPELSEPAAAALRSELSEAMASANWFTIGVMAPSADAALNALRALEASQTWEPLALIETSEQPGPVFLKANQKGGSIRIRIEHGLGRRGGAGAREREEGAADETDAREAEHERQPQRPLGAHDKIGEARQRLDDEPVRNWTDR